MGQIYESEWKWDFDEEEYTSDDDNYKADEDSGYISKSLKGFEINSAFQLGESSLSLALNRQFKTDVSIPLLPFSLLIIEL